MTSKITDHVKEALERFPHYLRKDNAKAMVSDIVGPFQELEDTLWQLLTERAVDTAIGDQLDAIGKLVGQPRKDVSDDVYRHYIRGKIAALRSNARINDLLKVVDAALSDDSASIVPEPQYPASIEIHISVSTVDAATGEALLDLLNTAVGGGIRLLLRYQENADTDTFAFDGAIDGDTFGDDADGAVGGYFSTVISKS